VVISSSSRTLQCFIDRLHSSHFNSCVVGLVRGGAAFQAKDTALDPGGLRREGAIRRRKAIAHPMQKSIEQLDIRQIIKQLCRQLFRHLDATETTS
jgi:hypothetical protein